MILARPMMILQDLARFWTIILQDSVYSFKIPLDFCMILHDNHSTLTGIASPHRNKA